MIHLNDIYFFSILRKIPYENISKILRLDLDPHVRPRDSKTVLSEHQQFHFGGTCFSLVNLVIRSLAIEGIKAYAVKGEIQRKSFPHFFAVAELEDKQYLIDPGYLINTPLEISAHNETRQQNGIIDFIVSPDGNGYQLKTATNGQHKLRYHFKIEALDENIFMDYWIRSFDYMNAIVASRFIEDKFIYINGNYVQIRSKGNIEKYDHKDKALYYLKNYFGYDEELIEKANGLLRKHRISLK
jgi:arylamine N-acetyltransferase